VTGPFNSYCVTGIAVSHNNSYKEAQLSLTTCIFFRESGGRGGDRDPYLGEQVSLEGRRSYRRIERW